MRRALILAVVLAAAAGCKRHRDPFIDPAVPIDVSRGAKFDVAVRARHKTAYQWVLVDSAALSPLRLVGRRSYYPAQDRNRVGAAGVSVWTFAAPYPGEATIVLLHKRPGVNEPPIDSARFRVRVSRW
ncbi:MAG TPA: protease inhibitor I42 family protein [Longimicrobium sp.]|nr:protease inhibitor I42 family protein [Longimicrobium sp.]